MNTLNIPIQFLRSFTAGTVPPTDKLTVGGLAINIVDRKLFTLDNTGAIQQIGVADADLSTVAFTGNYNDLLNKPNLSATYTLPAASATVLGGVKVAAATISGLSVDVNGELSNAGVISVNTRTGSVVLTATDVGLPTDLLSGPSGTIASKYLPSSLGGGLINQGNWNAATNTPTLANGGVGPNGQLPNGSFYVVATAGTTSLDGISNWAVGDLALVSNGVWTRLANAGATGVLSINGKTGVVTLSATDIPGLATVAVSGSYNDLSDKPTPYSLPVSTTSVLGGVLLNTTPQSAGVAASGKLATVALTGLYSDLINPPSNPDVARLPVNVQGNPNVLNEVFYNFATACQFPANFAGSVGTVKTVNAGVAAEIWIMKYVKGGNPLGQQIGTVSVDNAGNVTISSVGGVANSFAIGDELSYRFRDTNVARMTVTLLGQWI